MIHLNTGGQSGMQLGQMISLSLALHNVPEGLAVALVLQPRGYPKIKSGGPIFLVCFCSRGDIISK